MAVAIGKLDALMFVIGVALGSLVFGDMLYPFIKDFYLSGNLGKLTLPEWLGWNAGVVAFLIVIMAVGSFWLSEKAECSFHPYKNMRSNVTVDEEE